MISLRRAGTDDSKLVRAILTDAANDLTARFGPGHWSTARSIETLRKYADNGTLYVVESNSVAVGTLRLTDRKVGFYYKGWFTRPTIRPDTSSIWPYP